MTKSLIKNKTLQDKSKLGVWNHLVSEQKKKKPTTQNWHSRHQQLLQPPFSPVKVRLWRVPFRCCRSDRSRPRVWAGERGSVRPPPAARRHQTGQNPRGQMSRVQRHVLPPADLLLRLQRIRVVWNKPGHQTDPLIYHISHFFLCCFFFFFISHHRGLNKQGYQCRRESHFPLTRGWSFPWLFPSSSHLSLSHRPFRVQCCYSQKVHWQSHRQVHRVGRQQQRNAGMYLALPATCVNRFVKVWF